LHPKLRASAPAGASGLSLSGLLHDRPLHII